MHPLSSQSECLLLDLPALQELIIPARRFSHPVVTQSVLRTKSTLRSLRLTGQWSFSLDSLSTSSLCPGWARLTHVEMTVLDLSRLFGLLELATNLSSLIIGLYFEPSVWLQNAKQYTHTTLQSLSITNVTGDCAWLFPYIFKPISLPKLRLLEVCCGSTEWPHETFKAFLARSNPPMERLIFYAESMTTCEQRAE
ncbi:hypothetical protein K503DRAFT_598429 [Rhizopogon vinicolor AM-OR11-026]|uniref:F-box domain-containing protein n=1 Tax=Rhizopogon vinicolor AM-OR11-026 TaxID=1314800 RepID=A0A1B7MIW9_9AGAM|nr:hypothetical protein K503DRAFT_598429 [Rhizopogon vinicolor AM-OR11-026]